MPSHKAKPPQAKQSTPKPPATDTVTLIRTREVSLLADGGNPEAYDDAFDPASLTEAMIAEGMAAKRQGKTLWPYRLCMHAVDKEGTACLARVRDQTVCPWCRMTVCASHKASHPATCRKNKEILAAEARKRDEGQAHVREARQKEAQALQQSAGVAGRR